jgi:hypothetical protein
MEIFILGIISIIISLVLFIFGHMLTSPYMEKLDSWNSPPGKYLSSLNETGNIVLIRLSIIFLVVGIGLIILHLYIIP